MNEGFQRALYLLRGWGSNPRLSADGAATLPLRHPAIQLHRNPINSNCGAKVVIKSFFCCSSFINNANYLHLACIDTIFRTLTSVKSYLWAHAAYACMVGIPLRRWAQKSAYISLFLHSMVLFLRYIKTVVSLIHKINFRFIPKIPR